MGEVTQGSPSEKGGAGTKVLRACGFSKALRPAATGSGAGAVSWDCDLGLRVVAVAVAHGVGQQLLSQLAGATRTDA